MLKRVTLQDNPFQSNWNNFFYIINCVRSSFNCWDCSVIKKKNLKICSGVDLFIYNL